MALNVPFSAAPTAQTLTTAVVVYNQKAPFTNGNPCKLWSLAAQTVYGAQHPGTNSAAKYASIKPGVGATITVPTALDDMAVTAIAALTDANRMQVIVVKNRETVLTRVGSDAVPAGIQFRATDANTILLGTSATANDTFEIFVLALADIITLTGGATTAGRIYDAPCYSFMTATGLANLQAAL